jgi:hypothetical protein
MLVSFGANGLPLAVALQLVQHGCTSQLRNTTVLSFLNYLGKAIQNVLNITTIFNRTTITLYLLSLEVLLNLSL